MRNEGKIGPGKILVICFVIAIILDYIRAKFIFGSDMPEWAKWMMFFK